jgi:hypothetical protein
MPITHPFGAQNASDIPSSHPAGAAALLAVYCYAEACGHVHEEGHP